MSVPATTSQLPTHFIACVRTAQSAQRIRASLSQYLFSITVLQNDNVGAVNGANTVLLACKVASLADVLGGSGMRAALRGKLLISVLAGISAERLHNVLYDTSSATAEDTSFPQCRFVCAIPNVAVRTRSSMTVIAMPSTPLSNDAEALVQWLFKRIGHVKVVSESAIDAATVLCGAGPAFAALFLEALAAGVERAGIAPEEAAEMAARTLKGAADLILAGESPVALRKAASTEGGVTAKGLSVLVEKGFKDSVIRAMEIAVERMREMSG